MAYDPVLRGESLKDAFNIAAKKGIKCPETAEIKIPDDREPEISFLLQDMKLVHNIYAGLCASDDVIIVPNSERTNRGILVSLGQDTVDDKGYPVREIEKAAFTLRSRSSFLPSHHDGVFQKFDRSVKTVEKTTFRKEWESTGKDLKGGYDTLLESNPTLPEVFRQIDPETLRVSSVCLTSRAVYSFLHVMPDHNTIILYDVCNDACVMTTPHADHAVGYRREFEAEAKAIFSTAMKPEDTQALNEILDISLNRIRAHVLKAAPEKIQETSESKMAHSQRAAREFYESQFGDVLSVDEGGVARDGTDIALLQNVRPEDFAHKKPNIMLLSRLIPSADDLLPRKGKKDFSRYFRSKELHRPILRRAV